jgi:DNA-binding MarR family transcriptional regulator
MKYIRVIREGKWVNMLDMSASKHRIYHQLQLLAHGLKKSSDRDILAAADITTAQAAVLAIVADSGPVTQRGVASRLGINESAVTAMTGRLGSAGLLERMPDPADSRAWRLHLTDKGRAALEQIEAPRMLMNRKIESVLTSDEIAALADYISRIIGAFEEPSGRSGDRSS